MMTGVKGAVCERLLQHIVFVVVDISATLQFIVKSQIFATDCNFLLKHSTVNLLKREFDKRKAWSVCVRAYQKVTYVN